MSLVEVGCAQSAQKAFDMAEAAKIGRHRAQCAAAGLDYCSLVVSVGGGLSGDFVSKVVQPYFKQERAAAKKEGRSTWEVQRRLDRYLDHLACIVARHNALLIRVAESPSGSTPPSTPPSSPPRDGE